MIVTRTHGDDKDSWYWQGIMVLTRIHDIDKTYGIDKDSLYWQHPWYWVRLMVKNRYSWITYIREGRVLPVCGIFVKNINYSVFPEKYVFDLFKMYTLNRGELQLCYCTTRQNRAKPQWISTQSNELLFQTFFLFLKLYFLTCLLVVSGTVLHDTKVAQSWLI